MNTLELVRETKIVSQSHSPAEFWSILVDGKLITSQAHPFATSSGYIVLNECEFCYSCGEPEMVVRRTADNTLIWFVDPDPHMATTLPRHTVYEFDTNSYKRLLGRSSTELPELSQLEFEALLANVEFPSADVALYALPELPNDTMGLHTLKKICNAIAEGRIDFRFGDAENVHELTIGLDIAKIPECKLLIGQFERETVFRFTSMPHLPVWVSIRGEPNPFEKLHKGSTIAK